MAGFNLPPGVSTGDIHGNEPCEQWRDDGERLASAEMTLRDYFAAQVLSGIAEKPGEGCSGYIEQRVRVAYAIADAMLQERAK